ncbi:RPA-interacting protein [Pelodiscus sinensis]|uniref:RPA-interacting protein n=1 Tax=Pelodiscus sinensis TaxID=13735 RepID=UPI0003C44CF1|nr:RPA-interacting protein [Pelodiscus sinensis]|eukprot:XP_006136138.1 RPA-interacting protein [Pelodiscus sinensis]
MEAPGQQRRALYKGPAAPPWKETYRRRCVERLKNSRAKLLDRYRQAGENVHCNARGALVQEVMEEEWQALQALSQVWEDPDEQAVLEEIQQELILQEQLTIQEYERSLQFDQECFNAILDGLDTGSKITCPVCKRNHLTVTSHLVLCQCGLYISTQGMTEQKLRSLLEDSVTEHGHQCLHNPEFSITSGMDGEANLFMSCPVCDSWTVLL